MCLVSPCSPHACGSTSHTVSPVLSVSVRNHAVHFVGQLLLEPRHGPRGPARDEVRGGALHLVHAHVAGFGDLTLGEADELGVPGKDAEALGDQDLKPGRRRHQPFSLPMPDWRLILGRVDEERSETLDPIHLKWCK